MSLLFCCSFIFWKVTVRLTKPCCWIFLGFLFVWYSPSILQGILSTNKTLRKMVVSFGPSLWWEISVATHCFWFPSIYERSLCLGKCHCCALGQASIHTRDDWATGQKAEREHCFIKHHHHYYSGRQKLYRATGEKAEKERRFTNHHCHYYSSLRVSRVSVPITRNNNSFTYFVRLCNPTFHPSLWDKMFRKIFLFLFSQPAFTDGGMHSRIHGRCCQAPRVETHWHWYLKWPHLLASSASQNLVPTCHDCVFWVATLRPAPSPVLVSFR